MAKQTNSVRKAEAAPTLRERAERLRDAAGRFIRCKPVSVEAPASDAPGRALAARVIEYFGEEPIPEELNADIEVRDMARALLNGAPSPVPAARAEPAPDPILAAIDRTRSLHWARCRALAAELPPDTIDPTPEQNVATDAFFAHVDQVLLKTVPTTAVGCAALARYANEFMEEQGFCLDENPSNDQHVRILDLIARSPLLDGASPAQPPVPDFSGYTANDLRRTYDAFKLATDIMGLSGWAFDETSTGGFLLDAEGDRLSFFQGYIVDELMRRVPVGPVQASNRIDIIINRAIACGDYEEAARFAAEANAKGL